MAKNEILILKKMLENANIPFTYMRGGTFGSMPEDMDYRDIFYPPRPNSLIAFWQTACYREKYGDECGLLVSPCQILKINPKDNKLYILCKEKSICREFYFISVEKAFEIIKNHYEKELAEQ